MNVVFLSQNISHYTHPFHNDDVWRSNVYVMRWSKASDRHCDITLGNYVKSLEHMHFDTAVVDLITEKATKTRTDG
jgi:hypothetical protein